MHLQYADKFQPFIDADPSPNKKYLSWIVESYIAGGIPRLEDVGRTRDALEKFAKLLTLKTVLQEGDKDIKQFCGIAGCVKKTRKQVGLEDLVDKYRNVLEQHEGKKAKARAVKEEETVEVYSDDKIRIVQPRTEASACHYGQQTRWCTATTKGENMFKEYSATDKLYIIIPKQPQHEGEKYQLHCKDQQYMNEKDQPISLAKLLKRFPELKKTPLYYFDWTNNNDKEKERRLYQIITRGADALRDNVALKEYLQREQVSFFTFPLSFCGFWAARYAVSVNDRNTLKKALDDEEFTENYLVDIFSETISGNQGEQIDVSLFHFIVQNAREKQFTDATAIRVAERIPRRSTLSPDLYAALENRRPAIKKSPFYWITVENTKELKNLINEAGFDIDQQDVDGLTPLAFAAKSANKEAIKLLAKHGASPDKRDKSGATVLHYTVDAGASTLRVLIDSDAVGDVNAKNNAGRTALWLAVDRQYDDIVDMLIEELTASIDEPDNDGTTPLMLVAANSNDNDHLAGILLTAPADESIAALKAAVNKEGKTAAVIAKEHGNDKVLAMIEGREVAEEEETSEEEEESSE